MDPIAGAALVVGLGLAVAWCAATRRAVREREAASREWSGEDVRTDLWTSAARCPACGAGGGVLEPSGDGATARFTCLACGAVHVRAERG